MSKEEAKTEYIEAIKKAIEELSKTMNVVDWLEKIDPELPKMFALMC